MFLVHLATIPITGTGINPARSLGAAIIYNRDHAWDDHVYVLSLMCLFVFLTSDLFNGLILILAYSGFSGLDLSLELPLLLYITR